MWKEVLFLITLLFGISFNQRIEIDDVCITQSTYVEETCDSLNNTCPDAEYRKKTRKQRKLLNLCPYDIDNDYNPILCCFPPIKGSLDEIVGYSPIFGVGGTPVTFAANFSVYPHMAHIGYDSDKKGEIRWLCGGSLISEKFVLTAAHCLRTGNFSAKYVRLGTIYLNVTYPHVQDINITRRISHPDYNSPSHYNDIGLLELQTPAEINTFVKPGCLYPYQEIVQTDLVATGWGATSYGGAGSDVLLEIDLTLFDSQACNASYKNYIGRRLRQGIVDDIQFCAGGIPGGEEKDTCEGDSGGPVHFYSKELNIFYIVGVTSFGKPCGPSPGVYVKVSYYINWIESHIWPNSVLPNENTFFVWN